MSPQDFYCKHTNAKDVRLFANKTGTVYQSKHSLRPRARAKRVFGASIVRQRLSQGISSLSHKSRGRRRFVLERRRQRTGGLVVASQTVDSRLDDNKTELGVRVLAAALKVLAHSNSALLLRVSIPLGVEVHTMRWYRSSGISGARPSLLRIRRILLPVTKRT